MISEGFIHGRFQPFHNGHFAYLQAALDRSEFIWVGLTKIDLGTTGKMAGEERRDQISANPLTFYERARLISQLVRDLGISDRIGLAPFPIEHPERCPYFMPDKLTAFTTIKDEWNRVKIRRLIEVGYPVEVLTEQAWQAPNIASGSDIRSLIRSGSERWRGLVPESVARNISDELIGAFK